MSEQQGVVAFILSNPVACLSIVLGAVGLVLLLWLNQQRKVRLDKRHPTIPGLTPSDPQQGNLPDIGKAGSIHQFLSDLHKQYGAIVSFWWGQSLTVSLASPGLFRQISKLYNRPADLFSALVPLMTKDAIAYATDDNARRRHTAYSRCYSHGSLSNYYNTFGRVTNDLVTKWINTGREKIDIQEDMFLVAVTSLARTSFGQCFDSEEELLAYYHHHIEVWDELEMRVAEGPPEPGSERDQKFNKGIEVLRETMRRSMRMRKELGQDTDEPIAVDVIMDVAENEAQRLGDALDIFFSGFHSTGLVLTWSLYYLAKHQDVQEKLYQELCEVLGEEGAVDNDNIDMLVYTRQVLDESLRCSTLINLAGRYNPTEMTIDGHVLAPHTSMFIALGVTLEDETLWPEPEKFDPERFSPENQKAMLPYQFEPFGFAGKRKCPGFRFSIIQSTTVLSILIRKFKFHLADEHTEPITKLYSLFTAPKEKIYLKAEKRD